VRVLVFLLVILLLLLGLMLLVRMMRQMHRVLVLRRERVVVISQRRGELQPDGGCATHAARGARVHGAGTLRVEGLGVAQRRRQVVLSCNRRSRCRCCMRMEWPAIKRMRVGSLRLGAEVVLLVLLLMRVLLLVMVMVGVLRRCGLYRSRDRLAGAGDVLVHVVLALRSFQPDIGRVQWQTRGRVDRDRGETQVGVALLARGADAHTEACRAAPVLTSGRKHALDVQTVQARQARCTEALATLACALSPCPRAALAAVQGTRQEHGQRAHRLARVAGCLGGPGCRSRL